MKKILAVLVAVAMLAAVGYAMIGFNAPVEEPEPEAQVTEPAPEPAADPEPATLPEPEPVAAPEVAEPAPAEEPAPVALAADEGVAVAQADDSKPTDEEIAAAEKAKQKAEDEAAGVKRADVAPDKTIDVDRDTTSISNVESMTASATTSGGADRIVTITQDSDGNVDSNVANVEMTINDDGTYDYTETEPETDPAP